MPVVTVQALYLVTLLSCLVVLLAVVSQRLTAWAGVPALLLYLGFGLLLGESGLGIEYDDAALTQALGLFLLAVILADGGMTTRWESIRPVLGRSIVLATVGVAVSVGATAALVHLLLGVEVRTALILGAVVSSTDAAAVFSVLRRLPLRRPVAATLEAESGLNDPFAILLVTLLSSDSWDSLNPVSTVLLVGYELVAGVAIGLAIARVGQAVLQRVALPASGLYPVATLALALLAFAAAGALGASGFAAVYVAALWLGNAPLPHRGTTIGFVESLGWMAQISLFVLLGLLASPTELTTVLVPALVVGLVLLLVSRPLSVLVSVTPFRVPWREQAFLSWAGLRGAVPVVLATIPLSRGIADSTLVFNVVFVLVVIFTLVQAPTLPWVARRAGVLDAGATSEIELEYAPLGQLDAVVLQFEIPADSKLHGVTIGELGLPRGASVSLVVRDDASFVPGDEQRMRRGDQLLLVVPRPLRSRVEQRLRAVSRRGRLARWYGETGGPEPAVPPT